MLISFERWWRKRKFKSYYLASGIVNDFPCTIFGALRNEMLGQANNLVDQVNYLSKQAKELSSKLDSKDNLIKALKVELAILKESQ